MPLTIPKTSEYIERYTKKKDKLKLSFSSKSKRFTIIEVDYWGTRERKGSYEFFEIRLHSKYFSVVMFSCTGMKCPGSTRIVDKIRIRYSNLEKKNVKELISSIYKSIREGESIFKNLDFKSEIERKYVPLVYDPDDIFSSPKKLEQTSRLKKIFYEEMIAPVRKNVEIGEGTLRVINPPVEIEVTNNTSKGNILKTIGFKFIFQDMNFEFHMPVGKTEKAREFFSSLVNSISQKDATQEQVLLFATKISRIQPEVKFKISHVSFKYLSDNYFWINPDDSTVDDISSEFSSVPSSN